jgi:hypothetical protein
MSRIPKGVAFEHPLSQWAAQGEDIWANDLAIASNLINCAFLDESADWSEKQSAKKLLRELCRFRGLTLWQYWRLAFLARWRSLGACLQLASFAAAGWDDLADLSQAMKKVEALLESMD